MSSHHRRTFLKGTVTGGVLALAAGAGLLRPTRVLAAAWPKEAFESKDLKATLKAAFGSDSATESKDIIIKAPLQAENGAVVPIEISTKMDKVEAIGIVAEGNNFPLVATVHLSGSAAGFFSARIKLAKSTEVKAYVRAGGKLYMAKQEVKVTVGGCGG